MKFTIVNFILLKNTLDNNFTGDVEIYPSIAELESLNPYKCLINRIKRVRKKGDKKREIIQNVFLYYLLFNQFTLQIVRDISRLMRLRFVHLNIDYLRNY